MVAIASPVSPEDAIAAATADGWAHLGHGLVLYTKAAIHAEGLHEDPDDVCYGLEFRLAPYWLVNDCGAAPIPVFGAHDADLIAVLA